MKDHDHHQTCLIHAVPTHAIITQQHLTIGDHTLPDQHLIHLENHQTRGKILQTDMVQQRPAQSATV